MLDSLLPTPRRSLDWRWSLNFTLRTLLWIPQNGKMDGSILKQLTKMTSCNICHLCNNSSIHLFILVCYEFPRWVPQNGKNNLEQKTSWELPLSNWFSPKQRRNLPAAHGVVAPGEKILGLVNGCQKKWGETFDTTPTPRASNLECFNNKIPFRKWTSSIFFGVRCYISPPTCHVWSNHLWVLFNWCPSNR